VPIAPSLNSARSTPATNRRTYLELALGLVAGQKASWRVMVGTRATAAAVRATGAASTAREAAARARTASTRAAVPKAE
jgi:hypothetical protein